MHIINLATQALPLAYSKTKHFDPADLAGHDLDVYSFEWDEVGLIWGITVKVCS